MTTTIFKNSKNAKVYQIISNKDQHIYKAGELVRKVRTDDIKKLMENGTLDLTAKEVK